MTIDEFDDIIDSLIRIALPRNFSTHITAGQVLAILEAHCEGLRNSIAMQQSATWPEQHEGLRFGPNEIIKSPKDVPRE
jgi:hypothetical protein